MRRTLIIVVGSVLVLTACAGGLDDDATADDDRTTTTAGPATSTTDAGETGPGDTEATDEEFSALQIFAGPRRGADYPASLPAPTIDTDALLRGQVPDGIPAIDVPEFVSVDQADEWLDDDEAVVILDVGGEVRAYPIQILIWHEIINDVVGGIPVAITYCPLCNSAVSYERSVEGEVTTFGTSGLLFNSALVMYDRTSESLWTHFDGAAFAGVRTGVKLAPISSPLLAWSEFKSSFPDGLVLDRDATGYSRPYGSNPYVDYDNPDGSPFLFFGAVDGRLGAQQRVTGVWVGDESKAWTLEAISGGATRVTHDAVGGTDIVIFWKSGQATALESGRIDDGRDVGSVGVFVPELDGRQLRFRADGDRFVDDETASAWNVAGEAVEGPLAGRRLEVIHHLDTFWFAWFSYNPATELVGG